MAPSPPPQREVAQRGVLRDIVYAQLPDGRQPAKEFIASLGVKDRMSFTSLFLTMAEHGLIRNPSKFRPNIDKFHCQTGDINRKYVLAEFKISHGSGQRIFAYLNGRQWVLVSGFPKGASLESEMSRARRIVCADAAFHQPPPNSQETGDAIV